MSSVDTPLALTGLPVSSPIGFMAGLGLLRVCTQDHGMDVRLSWTGSHALLHGLDEKAIRELLVEHMRGRSSAPEFNFDVKGEDGKRAPALHVRNIPPADYRDAAAAFCGNARALGFLAGFGTDAVVNDKEFVARSRFDFSGGQQKLLHEMRLLAADLDPGAKRPRVPLAERIERGVFGGAYEKQHSFGWDPATLMTHAHQPAAPTDSATPGQPMLIWLAVESLPLHPVVPLGPRLAHTTGFSGGRAYVWPQWSEPLSLAEVQLLRQRPVTSLAQLPGVEAVWNSAVTSVGKFGFFLPATRTASVGGIPEGFAPEESET